VIINCFKIRKLDIKILSISFLLVLLLATGCNKHKIPKDFPDPEEMALILTDIHMLESSIAFLPEYSSLDKNEIPGAYKYILQKHGLSPAKFDTIRKWYVDKPELYLKVYDLVLENFSQLDADVRMQIEREKELKAEAKQLALEQKLQNLWQDSASITINPDDNIDSLCLFRIDVDTLDLSGRVKLIGGYQFLRRDESRSPSMMLSAFYNDSVADTV